jgi:aminobenzoyl-glutamate transport protein
MSQPSDAQTSASSATAPPGGVVAVPPGRAAAAAPPALVPAGDGQNVPLGAGIVEGGVAKRSFLQKALDGIEVVGNKVPHPVVIFFILAGIVIVLSQILYWLGTSVSYEVIDPVTDQVEQVTTPVKGLLTADGIRFIFTSPVRNFLNFNAVGVILVAMVGVGVAEEAGLISALIRKIVLVAPRRAMTFILVFAGVLSSVASDAGYIVLIPLGAAAFLALGRHPLAGLAAAFAGVAALFGVNLLITPLDGVLTEITNDAIHIVNPSLSIDLTANMWFSIVSSVLLSFVAAFITERIVEPGLGKYEGEVPAGSGEAMSADESKGLRRALYAFLAVTAFVALITLPPGAPLRNPETGAIVGNSPFMDSLIIVIMLMFLAAGAAYGSAVGTIKSMNDAIAAISKTFAGLGGLLFLFLVISQFLAYFNYTNMATVAAVSLGDLLESANVGAVPLLIGFVLMTTVIDVILGGAIPKWAIFAPIFVPLFMRLGVSPEVTLAAYRVGDSPVNPVTPLLAYFALIVVTAQKYRKDAGVGTIIAMMLPYTGIIWAVWTVLLVVWYLVGIPLGVGTGDPRG